MAFSGNNYSFAEVIFFFVLALSACGTAVSLSVTNSSTKSSAVLLRVDQSGKGDYKKIQDAIDAVPANNKELVFILVKPGIYKEKVFVPADKPFITLSGTKASETVITWSESGDIFESPTMTVLASDFVGRYLTIQVRTYIHKDTYIRIYMHIYVCINTQHNTYIIITLMFVV